MQLWAPQGGVGVLMQTRQTLCWGPPRCPSQHRLAPRPGRGSEVDKRALRSGGGLQIKRLWSGFKVGVPEIEPQSLHSGWGCAPRVSTEAVQRLGAFFSSEALGRQCPGPQASRGQVGGLGAGAQCPCPHGVVAASVHPLPMRLPAPCTASVPRPARPRAGPRGAQRAGLARGHVLSLGGVLSFSGGPVALTMWSGAW